MTARVPRGGGRDGDPMVLDGLRGYLQLANGLTDVTRERARSAARALVAQGEAGVGAVVPSPVKAQVTALTEDLLATSRANRDLLVHVVRGEVERSVARLGLVSKADLEAERRRADRLEAKVRELEMKVPPPTPRKAAAKKAATKKATTTRATTTRATTTKATSTTTPKAGA